MASLAEHDIGADVPDLKPRRLRIHKGISVHKTNGLTLKLSVAVRNGFGVCQTALQPVFHILGMRLKPLRNDGVGLNQVVELRDPGTLEVALKARVNLSLTLRVRVVVVLDDDVQREVPPRRLSTNFQAT